METENHILVLGLGESGVAAARLARLYGCDVTVLDSATGEGLRERADQLQTMDIRVCLDWNGDLPGRPDLAVISPGVPPESDLARAVEHHGIPVISELEFGYRFCACPIIAVTGTNGKTTTVELLVHCLRKAGYEARAAGNIGIPVSTEVRRSHLLDYLVLEVSSFQLLHIERFAPLAAAVLNVTEDHLDRHHTFDQYLNAKLRILENLPEAGRAVLRQDLADDPRVVRKLPSGRPITFAGCDNRTSTYVVSATGEVCRRNSRGKLQTIADVESLKLQGTHNLQNVLAALALTEAAGLDPVTIAEYVGSFAVGEHRLETVAIHNNIRFVNDSKATNPDALKHALAAVPAQHEGPNIHLIAGGIDKDSTFEGLEHLLESRVKGVFLIGASKAKLARQWGSVVSCRTYISLEAAFEAAAEEAVTGDVVLLAPACSSHDMFNDYAHRGRVFRELVERRLGE